MHRSTQNIRTIRPLKDGVIADFHAAEEMLRSLIQMIDTSSTVPAIPPHGDLHSIGHYRSGKTHMHRFCQHAGAKEVWMIQEPMAAAIGIGIDVEQPIGSMIVDIGGGTTKVRW